jgi:hypothetical protein
MHSSTGLTIVLFGDGLCDQNIMDGSKVVKCEPQCGINDSSEKWRRFESRDYVCAGNHAYVVAKPRGFLIMFTFLPVVHFALCIHVLNFI